MLQFEFWSFVTFFFFIIKKIHHNNCITKQIILSFFFLNHITIYINFFLSQFLFHCKEYVIKNNVITFLLWQFFFSSLFCHCSIFYITKFGPSLITMFFSSPFRQEQGCYSEPIRDGLQKHHFRVVLAWQPFKLGG